MMIKLLWFIVLFGLSVLQAYCDESMYELLQSSSTQDKYVYILNHIHFERKDACKLAFHNCLYSINNEQNLKANGRMECYPLWKSHYCLNNRQIFINDNCDHQNIHKKLLENINKVSKALEICNSYFYLSISSSSFNKCSKNLIVYLIFFYYYFFK
jgi:hypothetical protein